MNGLIVDLFAGGGGASLGIEMALGRPVDIAINHNRDAIAMHRMNHPGTTHFCNDVYQILPHWATKGRPVDLLWASPDCTHFSIAKGGKPRKQEIRDLAKVVVEWAKAVRPAVICLENVREFQGWGPLDDAGLPIKELAGRDFNRWVRQLRGLGYRVDWTELMACDYGAPTIRKRLFIVARCDGQPIVWPSPTHGPAGSGLLPYHTAAECIDWSIPAQSIFERKRPLAEATCRRIAAGIVKFALEAAEPFIVTYYGSKGEDFRGQSLGDPLATQTTENRHALVTPHLMTNTTGHAPSSMRDPLPTLTTGNHHYLVSAFLAKHYTGVTGSKLTDPMGTVTAIDHHSLVAAHLIRHFGQSVGQKADAPAPTVTAGGGGKTGLVASHLIKFRGTCQHGSDLRDPAPTVCAGGGHAGLVAAFLTKYYGQGTGQDLHDPAATVTSKDRLGLVTVPVNGDTYVLDDITLRMMQPRELFRAQGFPESYVIDMGVDGKRLTKTAQVKLCGNSVPPQFSEAVVRANAAHLASEEVAA